MSEQTAIHKQKTILGGNMKQLTMGLPKTIEESSRDRKREIIKVLQKENSALGAIVHEYKKIQQNKHENIILCDRNKIDEHIKNLTNSNLEKVRNKAIADSFNSFAIVASIILHDKFQFDEKGINKTLEHINNTFERVEAGEVSMADLAEEAKRIGMHIEVENE